jgi:hypothetical protein
MVHGLAHTKPSKCEEVDRHPAKVFTLWEWQLFLFQFIQQKQS